MDQRQRDRRAFRAGFQWGQDHGEASAREADQASVSEDQAFCQGSVDGAAGDRWRLERQS
jgi:hypothetical protein